MPLTLEPVRADTVYVARWGAAHARLGDPYSGACTIAVTGGTAEPKGLVGWGRDEALQNALALRRALRLEGVREMVWIRRTGTAARIVSLAIGGQAAVL